ncbi:glutamate--tRNA ligase [Candidatus Pacearchaeota archaeon]|nr:glutamate--tRNA ligase [Candidatus Pacearchaeota archaeon]
MSSSIDLDNEIKAYALRGVIEYGKTTPGNVLPKLFQHGLKKEDIKTIMPQITKIVSEINKLKKDAAEKEYPKYEKYVVKREEKEKGIPEIDIKKGMKVVTRMAPEPSKYNHLGHAMTFLLNYLYAKKYNGKCLLRFEDTNPEKVSQEYVDAMKSDVLDYLEIKPDAIRFVSDDMPLLYEYAEKLIKMEKAFMCFCNREKMQDLRHKGIECECRMKAESHNMEEWKLFLKGKFKEGEAVLRVKGDMKSQNHVMRDSVLFRQINAKHYRHGTKYKVWPMYDFYNPIEDSFMGITLILRSNEFDLRVELQDYIKDLLKLDKQMIVQYGRFNVIDFTTKGREIRELVESGELIGWDDPRLITLRALKRRGITKEAIYELTNQVGLSKNQVNLDFDIIAAINRKIIDKTSNRYFFVPNSISLKIINHPDTEETEIPIHPNKPEVKRVLPVSAADISISKQDYETFKGKEIRLLRLYNVKLPIKGKKAQFTSLENKDIPKITWVSLGTNTKVLMPDGNWIKGKSDSGILNLKEGNIIQFERFGFCRCDKNKKGICEFWFSHK